MKSFINRILCSLCFSISEESDKEKETIEKKTDDKEKDILVYNGTVVEIFPNYFD